MTRPCSCAVGNMLSATGDTLAPLVTLDKTSQLGQTTVTRSNESLDDISSTNHSLMLCLEILTLIYSSNNLHFASISLCLAPFASIPFLHKSFMYKQSPFARRHVRIYQLIVFTFIRAARYLIKPLTLQKKLSPKFLIIK